MHQLLGSKNCLAIDVTDQPDHWGKWLISHSQNAACNFRLTSFEARPQSQD